METNNTKTASRYIITRGHGDMVCHLSLSRGCSFTSDPARAITYATRARAEADLKFYAIDGAHVALAQ
jgi:hypothetical protein